MITGDLKKMLLYAGSLVIQSIYLVNELMFSCCALKIREGKVVIVTPTTPGRCYAAEEIHNDTEVCLQD